MSLLLILYRTVIVNNYNAFEMMIMIMPLMMMMIIMMMMMMASLMALRCEKSSQMVNLSGSKMAGC